MEWIDFKEKRPKELEEVIFLASRHEDWNYSGDKKLFQNRQFIGFINNYECDDISCVFGDGFVPFFIDDVTHWMPLPSLPEIECKACRREDFKKKNTNAMIPMNALVHTCKGNE